LVGIPTPDRSVLLQPTQRLTFLSQLLRNTPSVALHAFTLLVMMAMEILAYLPRYQIPNKTITHEYPSVHNTRARKLIHLRTISLIDVSLHGIVYRILLSNQNLSPRLNISLNLLIYRHFKTMFLELEFILFLLCSLICNHGVTLAVLFLYPMTTKDTCIFILSLF